MKYGKIITRKHEICCCWLILVCKSSNWIDVDCLRKFVSRIKEWNFDFISLRKCARYYLWLRLSLKRVHNTHTLLMSVLLLPLVLKFFAKLTDRKKSRWHEKWATGNYYMWHNLARFVVNICNLIHNTSRWACTLLLHAVDVVKNTHEQAKSNSE